MLLSKLLNVIQCCPPAHSFLNRMLDTLRSYPPTGCISLSQEFNKDLAWFAKYLPSTNGVFILHEDNMVSVPLYINACTTDSGAVLGKEAYRTIFLLHILAENRPICQLEALNSVLAITTWVTHLWSRLIHLYCDNAMAVVVFQAGCSKDMFPQASARQV